MKLFAFFLALPLVAASLVIDCGSPADQYFSTGSAPYTAPGVLIGDATMRVSACSPNCPSGVSFSYKIPADDDIPYVVKLGFLEPTTSGTVRRFNVVFNDATTPTWTLSPPRLAPPFYRSTLVMAVDGFITIRFDSLARSAMVSSIEIIPLFQILGTPSTGGVLGCGIPLACKEVLEKQ